MRIIRPWLSRNCWKTAVLPAPLLLLTVWKDGCWKSARSSGTLSETGRKSAKYWQPSPPHGTSTMRFTSPCSSGKQEYLERKTKNSRSAGVIRKSTKKAMNSTSWKSVSHIRRTMKTDSSTNTITRTRASHCMMPFAKRSLIHNCGDGRWPGFRYIFFQSLFILIYYD